MNNQFGTNNNQSQNNQFNFDNNQNANGQFDLNDNQNMHSQVNFDNGQNINYQSGLNSYNQPNNYNFPEYPYDYSSPKIEAQYAEEDRIRKIVREELQYNKPKKIWLRVIALILVGALLGTGATYGVLSALRANEKIKQDEPAVVEKVPEYTQENVQVEIDLGETSTVEMRLDQNDSIDCRDNC